MNDPREALVYADWVPSSLRDLITPGGTDGKVIAFNRADRTGAGVHHFCRLLRRLAQKVIEGSSFQVTLQKFSEEAR